MAVFSRTSSARRWAVPLFFAAVLLLGWRVFGDYGVSIDEDRERLTGLVSLKYVGELLAPRWVAARPDLAAVPTLAEYPDHDYGVAFQAPVGLLEEWLRFDDEGAKYLLRHFCTFLVWWGGLVALYQLAARRFRDWRLGLLAALFMLLSPRMFAEGFYNCKDAVFMAVFTMGLNAVARLVLRPSLGRALWCAVACALAVDVRIMGILLPAAAVGLLCWRRLRGELRWGQLAGVAAVYLAGLAGGVVLFWPYLWASPLENFVTAFHNMSVFRWGGTVLYFGEYIAATALPWHYAPVWMGITTPLLYLAAGLLGVGLVLRQVVRSQWRLWRTEGQLQDLLFLGAFLAPLAAVIGLNSVLYDGWRQLYFIYPPFLLLAVRGWVAVAGWRPGWASWPKLVGGGTALCLLATAAQMVRDHPLQNVYFNALAGSKVEEQFELDYWGVGFRQDLEYILAHELRSTIKVYAPTIDVFISQAAMNRLLIPAFQRNRLVVVKSPEEADYFITNYRWHQGWPYPYTNEVFPLRVDGRRIHSVFQLH